MAVRNPERYHQLREAQRLVGEGKAPHAGSLGPYPDGAFDRFFDAIEAGKTIDEARILAGITPETLRWMMEINNPGFDLLLELALEIGSGRLKKEEVPEFIIRRMKERQGPRQ
jgi:hypothetical protein